MDLAQRFKERYVTINGNSTIDRIHSDIIDEMKKKKLIK